MGIDVKVKCDAACCNELDIDCTDIYDIDQQVVEQSKEKGWLVDEENDSFYCPKHATEAAEELGIEYGN